MQIRAKIKFAVVLSLMLGLGVSERAFGQSNGGGSGGSKVAVTTGRYEAFMSAGYLAISTSASVYDIAPGFQLIPFAKFSWLQVGGEIAYQKIGYRGGSASNFQFMAGPTANLGGATVNDSFFVSLGFAFRAGSSDVVDTSTVDPNGIGFYFFAGKRFPIAGGFSIRPSLGVVSCGTTGMVFRPFAVSYHF
jgi:hypothetical protein